MLWKYNFLTPIAGPRICQVIKTEQGAMWPKCTPEKGPLKNLRSRSWTDGGTEISGKMWRCEWRWGQMGVGDGSGHTGQSRDSMTANLAGEAGGG